MAKRQSNAATPTREKLEQAIERAIDALDALDGDTDLEPEEDCGRDESEFAGLNRARDPASCHGRSRLRHCRVSAAGDDAR